MHARLIVCQNLNGFSFVVKDVTDCCVEDCVVLLEGSVQCSLSSCCCAFHQFGDISAADSDRKKAYSGQYGETASYVIRNNKALVAFLCCQILQGSMTALPIIETQAGDVSAYIPTNVISITDGQIFLETELFHSGVMPAVNPGISVSRVGGNAQIKAMKKVAGTLKLIYSQYRELQSFAQFGSDLDADTKARLEQGARIVEVLKQNQNSPVPAEKQVAIFYAVTKGILSAVKVSDVHDYEMGLYTYLDTDAEGAAVMQTIRSTGKLEEETENQLKTVLDTYTKQFLDSKPV